ncbi:MAG: type III-B CRISPR module RAMP protein Cmr1 [Candidatus Binatia bacterium]
MEERKTLTVTLETVTPLFLGGAEPRGAPELRSPAFRGALRYWLRAALGGVIGDNSLDGLHKLESAVFGSTDYGSPMQVRLRGTLRSSEEKTLPHKEGREVGPRQAFTSGQTFELLMSQLRSNDETTWQTACSALNLALTFGGVGLRSRRGYGTLRVRQSSDPALVLLTPTTLEEWKQYVKRVPEHAIASTRHLARSRAIAPVELLKGPTQYPCASRLGLVRVCDQQAPSAMDAVKRFMDKAPKDHALGGITPRQASPLWVRPIQLDTGYGLLLTVLASSLKGRTDYSFVAKFLDENFKGEDVLVKGWNA